MYIFSLTDTGSVYESNSAWLGNSVGFCKFCEIVLMTDVVFWENSISDPWDDDAWGFAYELSYSSFLISNVSIYDNSAASLARNL